MATDVKTARLAPVLGGLLSDLKAQAYEWDVRGRRFKAPLLMLIDEAGNMPLSWLPQVASTCAGIARFCADADGTGACTWAAASAVIEPLWYGRAPVSSSYATTPSPYRSLAGVTGLPSACSGAR